MEIFFSTCEKWSVFVVLCMCNDVRAKELVFSHRNSFRNRACEEYIPVDWIGVAKCSLYDVVG